MLSRISREPLEQIDFVVRLYIYRVSDTIDLKLNVKNNRISIPTWRISSLYLSKRVKVELLVIYTKHLKNIQIMMSLSWVAKGLLSKGIISPFSLWRKLTVNWWFSS